MVSIPRALYSLHPLKKLSKLKVHILFRHVNDANLPSFNKKDLLI